MRGIVLAGGTGSRLGDVTKVVNKHCLLVHDRPMIMWPIKVLRDWGIDDITIVSSEFGVIQLMKLLGQEYQYRIQERPGGIVDAILCAERSGQEDIAVILGDNIFWPTPEYQTACFLQKRKVEELQQFGVPRIFNGKIQYVVEKPQDPPSQYALTGLYTFPPNVFQMARLILPSARGEKEITDLLNIYADNGYLDYTVLTDGFWGDAGTFEGIYQCTKELRKCES